MSHPVDKQSDKPNEANLMMCLKKLINISKLNCKSENTKPHCVQNKTSKPLKEIFKSGVPTCKNITPRQDYMQTECVRLTNQPLNLTTTTKPEIIFEHLYLV